jgi:UDP-glucuronate decarboxylase
LGVAETRGGNKEAGFMRVLVTGAAGFIGSHLSETLLQGGHSVIGIDNYYSGQKNNISNLKKYSEFTFKEHDITNELNLNVDYIFNLACPASPVAYQRDPVATVKTNVLGAINLLELAKNLGSPILQASTSEVYGDPDISPQSEKYLGNVNPIGVRACYDEGKRVAETLFFDYFREYDVKIQVVRIFNTYGPRMRIDDGRVVSNFIVQALKNEPITIYGKGQQTRSFCYVSDLVSGLISMFEKSEAVRGPVNLGNPGEFSMLELAKKVLDMTGSTSELLFQELPADDPKQRCPDISLANEALGWSPTVELSEGLKTTIDYFREELSREHS